MTVIAILGALSLLLGAVLGRWMARGGHWAALGITLAAGLAFFGWVLVSVQGRANRTGFDGVAEVALAAVFALPFTLGVVSAAAFTFWQERRR